MGHTAQHVHPSARLQVDARRSLRMLPMQTPRSKVGGANGMARVCNAFDCFEFEVLNFQSSNPKISLFPNSESLFDFNDCSSRVRKDPSDLLPGSRRVAVGLAGIAVTT